MRKVLFIDVINASSWYNFCLMTIFRNSNLPVEFLTSKFLWDKNFPNPPATKIFFFSVSTFFCDRLHLQQKTRQWLRAIEYPFDLIKLAIYIKKNNIKTVHFNWSRLPQLDVFLIKFLKKRSVRVIYTAHNFLPHDSGKKFLKNYLKIYHNVDKIITLSEFVKNEIIDNTRLSSKDITVIPHTNYKPVLDVVNKHTSIEKERINKFSFLFFGAIHPYKGVDLLLKAYKIVQDKHPDCTLKIYGNNFLKDDQLFILIDELELDRSRLDLKLEFIPMIDCIRYIQQSDIVILPYKKSSQSGVIPLINSVGKPIIATNVGGIPEMIRENENGFIVEANSPQKLAYAMSKVIEMPELLKKLQYSTYQTCSQLFSDKIITKLFKDIYF